MRCNMKLLNDNEILKLLSDNFKLSFTLNQRLSNITVKENKYNKIEYQHNFIIILFT